jgi:hypothetical protein
MSYFLILKLVKCEPHIFIFCLTRQKYEFVAKEKAAAAIAFIHPSELRISEILHHIGY